MTAVPLDHPEGGGYQVRVGVSLGESLLARGARPGHNRYVLACCNTLGSGVSGARAWPAPGATTGAWLEAGVPAAAAPAAAIMSASVAIDRIPSPSSEYQPQRFCERRDCRQSGGDAESAHHARADAVPHGPSPGGPPPRPGKSRGSPGAETDADVSELQAHGKRHGAVGVGPAVPRCEPDAAAGVLAGSLDIEIGPVPQQVRSLN